MKPRTCIPTVVSEFEPGTHIQAAIVYGSTDKSYEEDWASSYSLRETDGVLVFYRKGEAKPCLEILVE